MTKDNIYLPTKIFSGIYGHNIDAYLISLEGWRRGLTLTWYREQTPFNKFNHTTDTAGKFFSLESKERKHFFYRSRGDLVSNASTQVCIKKQDTKDVLKEKNISVPEGEMFDLKNRTGVLNCAAEIGYPVVVKPLSESMGRGVFTDITDEHELNEILDHYETSRYNQLLIEKHYYGDEYRIYVVGDEVISVVYRERASVIGDGKSSIRQLISKKNALRKKNPNLKNKLLKIDFDMNRQLKRQQLTLDSILDNEQQVFLRSTSNLSIGGEPFDVTDAITNEIKSLAVNTLKAIGDIPHAGVDIIIDPEDPKKGVVIEVNPTAGITFHVFPFNGEMRDVPGKIIDYYFPETIGKPKNNFIFNYKEATEILKDGQYESLQVARCPQGDITKYTVVMKGSSITKGRILRIRRSAMICSLHGEITRVSNDIVEMNLAASRVGRFETFLKRIKKRYPDYQFEVEYHGELDKKYRFRGIEIK